MITLIMMRGLPASGKSTEAKKMLSDFGSGNAKIVNKDLLREMLDNGYWSNQNEKFLLGIRDKIIESALTAKKHVIVDDTNLNPKHEIHLRALALQHKAHFDIMDFSHITVDECIKRDLARTKSVGEQVIRKMYRDFLAPKVEPPAFDPNLPSIMIVDIDGTVMQMNGRRPFEWSRVAEDLPRHSVIRAILGYGYKWIYFSGRDECCRAETEESLLKHLGVKGPLYMRAAGDMRKDTEVKLEMFDAHIRGKFNVEAIFDDRPQVIRLWRELGFGDRLFDVGDGREF